MRTTPIPILLSEANEPPLETRRKIILAKFSLRISGWIDNPVAPRIRGLKQKLESTLRAKSFIKEFAPVNFIDPVFSNLNKTQKPNRPTYYDHPWEEIAADFDPLMDLVSGFDLKKSQYIELEFRDFLGHRYNEKTPIYTDGSYSERDSKAGSSYFIPSLNIKQGTRLYNCYSALAAELYAIFQSLKYIAEINLDKVVICTDSMAALIRIKERMKNYILDPIIHKIAKLIFTLTQKGKRIKFLWIPA